MIGAIVRVETLKLRVSTVGVVGTIAVVGGIGLLSGGMLLAAASGQPDLVAKLGPDATGDWDGLLSVAAQITGAGGLLGCGVVLAWIFGREFSDSTVSGLFALPAGRGRIAAGKLIVYALWGILAAFTLAALLLLIGLIAGLGIPSPTVWAGLARQCLLGVLTGAVAVPVAWVTTLSRSILGGVTTAITLVVIAQVGVLAGAGGWMPIAAPALWAMSGGASVQPVQLLLAPLLAAAAAALTLWSWHRLQLDR